MAEVWILLHSEAGPLLQQLLFCSVAAAPLCASRKVPGAEASAMMHWYSDEHQGACETAGGFAVLNFQAQQRSAGSSGHDDGMQTSNKNTNVSADAE
jgi:hypothetical protein